MVYFTLRFVSLVDLPNLHLLPAYKVICVSLSQYEIIIFYVLILWTFSAGAKMTEKKAT